MGLRVAAVDDERHVLDRLERLIPEIEGVKLSGLFENGEQLMAHLESDAPDVVFLDIEMPGANGLELADRVLDINADIDVIFLTAHDEYAVNAFEVHAIDYILKPFTKERLAKAVDYAMKRAEQRGGSGRGRKDSCEGGDGEGGICRGDGRVSKGGEDGRGSKRGVDGRGDKDGDRAFTKPIIQCFGSFEVIVEGRILTWKNSKAKEILAFYVHNKGQPVNWEKITDAIWPEYDYEKAHANFHTTNYLLRNRLAEAGISGILENKRGNYRINPEKIECDLYEYEELLSIGRNTSVAELRKAAALHKGAYMEENGYLWAYPKAGELEVLYHDIKEKLGRG